MKSGFCPCGAWRGELGSEPTPSLFIEHLVSIFDEVKRVLRPDGLCFVNLGDSYSGSGKGPTGHNGIGDQGERQGFNGRNAGFNERWGNSPGKKKQELSQKTEKRPAYAGIPAKNLLLVPQRFAIAMQERGWIVRSEIVWAKTSAMPESVRDRPTSAWEPIWMFSKQARYFYDAESVRQPATISTLSDARTPTSNPPGWSGNPRVLSPESRSMAAGSTSANLRNVWTLGPSPFADAHFATFPPEIPRRCILAGSRPGDTVLDPFLGSGTTLMVADRLGRSGIGVELSPTYAEMARKRIEQDAGTLFGDPVSVEAPQQIDLFGEVAG
jgi:DNA modification methylase